MRWIDRWRWLAICLALPFAACDLPPEQQAEMACTTVCSCVGGLLPDSPQLDACVQECVTELNFDQVSEDCFECVTAHANACSTLEADCEPICDGPEPQPDVPTDGGM